MRYKKKTKKNEVVLYVNKLDFNRHSVQFV